MTIRWPFLRVRQESVCRKRGLEAAEHCTPADRLNRGDFANQIRANRRTTSAGSTHQPAAELHRWAALCCTITTNCYRYLLDVNGMGYIDRQMASNVDQRGCGDAVETG